MLKFYQFSNNQMYWQDSNKKIWWASVDSPAKIRSYIKQHKFDGYARCKPSYEAETWQEALVIIELLGSH